MRNHTTLRCGFRQGVTILEVLFATGIAIFGLVGIASLIAVGGRNASDANNSTESQAVAQLAYSDFLVRGYHNRSQWIWFDDRFGVPNPFPSLAVLPNPLPRGTSVPGVRTPNRHAVCIDPAFFSDPVSAMGIRRTFDNSQVFRPGLFPYFQDNYNPLDPASPLSINLGRLLRVGIGNGSGRMLPAKSTDRVFLFADDVAISMDEDDQTQATTRLFNSIVVGQSVSLGQALAKGEYSWFATLCPRELTAVEIGSNLINLNVPETTHTLSIVVCKRRDRTFDPASEIPSGERVVAVSDPTGFQGGSGGRVTLSASRNDVNPLLDVSDSLRVGEWVMLCKQQSLTGGAVGTICRWYRIIALDIEADESAASWSRSVILDGPDWVFDAQPTQATLVAGVVTVVERVVRVQ